jgi:hypothetical protein
MADTTTRPALTPATQPSPERPANRLANRLTGLLTGRLMMLPIVAVLIAIAVAAYLPTTLPAMQPASAPTTSFSATRALAHLPSIASVPHPTGSAAQIRVQDYLVGTLQSLGVTPQKQTGTVTLENGAVYAATVTNIFATIPGRDSTGLVLLVAHYDSVPIGPGAADNGSNVAALLEVVRALRAGPQPRNDVAVLFTDAEEQGLLGAKAFADSHAAGDPNRVVVLNLEARGVTGPVIMFEMAGSGLTGALRSSGAISNSLAVRLYQTLPNTTDMTVLRAAGMRGLNFAFIDGVEHYHTAHDDLAHLDGRSTQAMGDGILAATHTLADSDLAAAPGPAMTYFSLFGTVLAYPSLLDLPLSVLAAAGCVLLLLWGRRRGLSLRAFGQVALGLPLCGAALAAVAVVVLRALILFRPDLGTSNGAGYGSAWYAPAEAALLLVALVGWYRAARRMATGTEVAVAVSAVFAVCSFVCAVVLPAATYLFVWPALLGVGAAAAVLRQVDPPPFWRAAAAAVPAAAALPLIIPFATLLEAQPLAPELASLRVLLATLLVAALLPVVQRLPSPRRLTAAMVAVAVAAAGAIVTLAIVPHQYGTDQPRTVSLGYVLDADTRAGMWVSTGGRSQPIVGPLVSEGTRALDSTIPHLGGGPNLHTAPAPASASLLPGVHADVSITQDGTGMRTLHLHFTFPADAYSYGVYADTTGHQIVDATVDGAPLPGGRLLTPNFAPWGWGFGYAGPPPGGSDLVLNVRGNGPLRIIMTAVIASLPPDIGAPALPPDLSVPRFPEVGGQTFVVNTYRI